MNTPIKAVLNTHTNESRMDNGVIRSDRKLLSVKLSEVLADSYMLNLKTQVVHWNISGPLFYAVHQITEQQYKDMNSAIDNIAERIRAIGFVTPINFDELRHYASIRDFKKNLGAVDMVRELARDNEYCAKILRSAVEEAEMVKDVESAGLLSDRIGQHEKNAWMLNALVS
ncbi:Dps family protein [Aliikangiella sp. G2MR2-5]|uniref:Dps family protein n=1 Tax=Aliikangiella sp. G2MR2-5 TaxID=2788943 RepID=UPI001AEE4CC6|nr:DNA starvation/stationary phase protection protein [Aliikangiella sp. G2MR2-5]